MGHPGSFRDNGTKSGQLWRVVPFPDHLVMLTYESGNETNVTKQSFSIKDMMRIMTLKSELGIDKRLVLIYTASFIAYLSNAYTIMMLYPFLSFMTKFFLPDKDTASINNYAGIYVASYFGGRVLGSYIWGSLADACGRKPVLVANCVFMAVSALLLAFSVNYTMAVVFRFILGLSNGVIVILRAVIAESSTDANQTFGFSVLSFSWMTAAVMAPLFSGLSADPIGQYNLMLSNGTLKSFLTGFPYAPPFILNSLVCISGAFAAGFILPETLDKTKKKWKKLSTVHTGSDKANATEDIGMQDLASDHSSEAELHVLVGNEEGDSTTLETAREHEKKADMRTAFKSMCPQVKHWCTNLNSTLRNKVFVVAILLQCLLAVIESSSDPVYALWFATPLTLGGIGFTVRDIGISSTVIAVIYLPFSLFIYPLLAKFIGSIQTAQLTAIVMAVMLVLSPNIHYLALSGPTSVVWLMVIASRTLMVMAFSTCFAAQSLFIGNSVSPEKLGTANGLALFVSDIVRSASPALFGAIYAISLSQRTMSIGFPVDYNLAFILYGVILLVMVLLQACLPSSINHKRTMK